LCGSPSRRSASSERIRVCQGEAADEAANVISGRGVDGGEVVDPRWEGGIVTEGEKGLGLGGGKEMCEQKTKGAPMAAVGAGGDDGWEGVRTERASERRERGRGDEGYFGVWRRGTRGREEQSAGALQLCGGQASGMRTAGTNGPRADRLQTASWGGSLGCGAGRRRASGRGVDACPAQAT